jgi:LmbE family N-acetylglucosaminyl deacetylase
MSESTARGLPRRVLAVGAHPDDIELLCAGTLARFKAEGSEVLLAVATRGDRGGPSPHDQPLDAVRRREAESAAALLGAPVAFLGLGDARVSETPRTRLLFVRLLRRVRPELVITHGPDDYHEDHVRVGRLTAAATWFAASAGHDTGEPPLAGPPAVVYMDNLAGMNFEPTHYVDVTATMDLKRRMLACHASQLARSDGGLAPLEELAETLARLRGFQCGVRYAEGFRPAPLWGRRRPEPLFP